MLRCNDHRYLSRRNPTFTPVKGHTDTGVLDKPKNRVASCVAQHGQHKKHNTNLALNHLDQLILAKFAFEPETSG